MHAPDQAYLRIGELGRRLGVSAELLRAWERRYGVLAPARTTGGFRLYSDADERRVRRMLEHVAGGLSAAEAARLALAEPVEPVRDEPEASPVLGVAAEQLRRALDAFDGPEADAALDRLLSAFTLETVLGEAVGPYLRELGVRWECGEASVAQEHFASNLLRGRLLGLARGWGAGGGPQALLACLPGEQHDLGLLCFGLALHGRGWQITFLGPDTPLATIAETARALRPAIIVLTAMFPEYLAGSLGELAELSRAVPLAIAGAGASSAVAAEIGARYLEGDPVVAAREVAGEQARTRA